jgi:N-carbamoyl-L-amino-acid hydrolase
MTPTPRSGAGDLWRDLMHSATVGATPEGGLDRQTLTPEDAVIRAWFAQTATSLGATVQTDSLGSQFAIFPGAEPRAPIAMGSHLDTQPTGGRFDGVLGVMAGLAAIRALRAARLTTRHPIAVINWTNEEGARFAPAMLASGVHAGVFTEAYALSRDDASGISLAEALARSGQAGTIAAGAQRLAAYFELHIEQGPILEQEGFDIGVVTGVQGIAWFDVTVTGAPCHAGTTPMHLRRDPVLAAAAMIQTIHSIATADANARATVGDLAADPGSRNTVAATVRFTVDLRHPDTQRLAALESALRDALPPLAAAQGCAVTIEEVWHSAPVTFDAACVQAVEHAATSLGARHRRIVSGAGHDAVYLARTCPTAMIFTPCLGGISHHPAESITREQAALGADVLLNAVLAYDMLDTRILKV